MTTAHMRSTGCAPSYTHGICGTVPSTYTSDPRTALTAGGLADREGST